MTTNSPRASRPVAKPQDTNLELRLAIITLNFSEPLRFSSHPFILKISEWKPPPQLTKIYSKQISRYNISQVITEVNSPTDHARMIRELKSEPVWALDLEHHDANSYSGITCLITISTPTKNFLIDPFNLNKEIKTDLKRLLESGSHTKILHASFNDLKWLQRDYNIFAWPVVDTQILYRLIELKSIQKVSVNKPNISLVDILKKYLPTVQILKEETREDFRIRPIPEGFKRYAVNDTIYLIPIFNELQKDFRSSNRNLAHDSFDKLLISVVKTVGDKALYQGKVYSPPEHILDIFRNRLSGTEDRVFRALHEWRSDMAKVMDENPKSILSDGDLLQLSTLKERDIDMDSIRSSVRKSNRFLNEGKLIEIRNVLITGRYRSRPDSCKDCGEHVVWLTDDGTESQNQTELELWKSWRPIPPDLTNLPKSPRDWSEGDQNGIGTFVFDLNKFHFSRSIQLSLYGFTSKDLKFFIRQIEKSIQNLRTILRCSICRTTLKDTVVGYCGCPPKTSFHCKSCRMESTSCVSCGQFFHHVKFRPVDEILDECNLFQIRLLQRNCAERLLAISTVLRQCEMKMMCQYCFGHLERTMLLEQNMGKPRTSECCRGCDKLYMQSYPNYNDPISLPIFDEIVDKFRSLLDELLRYCVDHKIPKFSATGSPYGPQSVFKIRALKLLEEEKQVSNKIKPSLGVQHRNLILGLSLTVLFASIWVVIR